MWTFWYIREASTAIYVANMPMCWSLMRRLFKLRAFNGISSGGRSRSKSAPIATSYTGVGGSRIGGGGSKTQNSVLGSKIDRSERGQNGSNWWESRDANNKLGRSESEEYIVGSNGMKGSAVPLEIWESREVAIDRGSVRDQGSVTTIVGGGGNTGEDKGMRTKMYDGVGKEYETRTTVTAIGGRKSESGSSRSLRL
jgi:hypothetical protein